MRREAAIEASRRRMQEQFDAKAALFAEKEKEVNLNKTDEKVLFCQLWALKI